MIKMYVKLFEDFISESLDSPYEKRVGWIMQTNDIKSTSGDVNTREKKYNLEAKNFLYHNFFTKEKENEAIPEGIPILYYGGSKDKESEEFLQKNGIPKENLYNQRELLPISGDKTIFGKTFEKKDWLPKTVYSKEDAIEGSVGFPLVAKIKNGHSGLGVKKFDNKKELAESKDKFDLFCQFIDFDREYRVVFCKETIVAINERVPTIEDDSSIQNKDTKDKIKFTYVYQDLKKVPLSFIKNVLEICKDIRKKLPLDLWSLDIVIDKKGKMWVMETSSATGLGSVKMCEIYKAIYEDFYKEKLPDAFLEDIYKRFVVTGHQNYWPKYKKEIESSQWAMDYSIITNAHHKDGYRYFFNLNK